MTPQELKNSILQLAIQGKLVEQRPEEGTAAELLEKILAAKDAKGRGNKLTRRRGVRGGGEDEGISNLPKAAKSHHGKFSATSIPSTLSAISASPRDKIPDDEKPFDIPESWEWARLGEVVEIYTGKRDANFGSSEGEYDFFTCSNQPIKCSSYSYDGEFLIMPGNGANIGMVIHYKGKFEAYQRTYLLENRFGIFMDYLEWHLKANWKQYNADKMYGSAIPYIKLGNLTNYLVAIPPLSEQKRIVAKLEELLPLCEWLK